MLMRGEVDAQGRSFGVRRLNGAEARLRNQTVWCPADRGGGAKPQNWMLWCPASHGGEGEVPEKSGLVPGRPRGMEARFQNQSVWYPLSRRGEGKVPELGGLVPSLVAQLVTLVPMSRKSPGQFLQSAEHGEPNPPFWEPGSAGCSFLAHASPFRLGLGARAPQARTRSRPCAWSPPLLLPSRLRSGPPRLLCLRLEPPGPAAPSRPVRARSPTALLAPAAPHPGAPPTRAFSKKLP